jgi:hypothetical protein
MSGPITTGSFPKMLWEGINRVWGDSYNEYPEQYTMLFDMDDSEKSFEQDVEQIGLGLAGVKPQGAKITYDTMHQGVVDTFQHIAYATGYIVTHEEFKDNLYAKAAFKRTKQLKFVMRQTCEHVAANVYNRGFDAAYVFGNAQPLFSVSHPTDAGVQANRPATSADFSEQAIEDQIISINQTKNARGLQIPVKVRRLIIPVEKEFEAARILKSLLQNDTANNAINALRAMNAIPEGAKVNQYLTDPGAYFFRTDVEDSFRGFWRERAWIFQDNDGDTLNRKVGAYQRLSFGRSDFRGGWGVPGP